jgi:phosphopantetheinyl transferase (holo-ACP synthase)
MAQAKINGSTDWPTASNKPNFTSEESGGIPATLVIHDDKHERVFTESEVTAMEKNKNDDLKWALQWMKKEAAFLRETGPPQVGLELAIQVVADKYGIVLDPA